MSAALRLLSSSIPQLDDLGLAGGAQFSRWNKGIVLVTGETGSGKSTTLAAILRRSTGSGRFILMTLEDPIEYVYTPKRAIINQREVGTDVEDYEKGLYAALREDPDVILIGEMRTLETCCNSNFTVSKPIPDEPPVTTATLSSTKKLMMDLFMLYCCCVTAGANTWLKASAWSK